MVKYGNMSFNCSPHPLKVNNIYMYNKIKWSVKERNMGERLLTKVREYKHLYNYSVNLSFEKNQLVITETLKYYVKKALLYKYTYYVASLASLLLNFTIPVINQIDWLENRVIITIISSVTALITSTIGLMGLKDKWYRSRTAAENIKSECIKFNACIGIYEDEDVKRKEKNLILNFESIINQDKVLWKEELNISNISKVHDENKK